MRENLVGIPPEEYTQNISLFSKYRDVIKVYKSAKKGQSSFRISKNLLDNLWNQSTKLEKKPQLILSIGEYVLTCNIQKQTM